MGGQQHSTENTFFKLMKFVLLIFLKSAAWRSDEVPSSRTRTVSPDIQIKIYLTVTKHVISESCNLAKYLNFG